MQLNDRVLISKRSENIVLAFFGIWLLMQLAIGPFAYLNKRKILHESCATALEASLFLPTSLAWKNQSLQGLIGSYVRLWLPSEPPGRCGLELLREVPKVETDSP